jgi:transposase
MARAPLIIRLTDEEKSVLREWSCVEAAGKNAAERAEIILLSSKGLTVETIAGRLDTRPARVSKWRRRFARHGLFGLSDFQRRRKPLKYDESTERRVLDLLEQPAPEGHAKWNGKLLSRALGDVSEAQVWRILRRNEVQLERRHSWWISTKPEFTPKAADIVGLYLDPPESALVLCVDETMTAQRGDSKAGRLRLTSGKAVRNFARGEQFEAPIALVEALAVMSGHLHAAQPQRRCRRKFLDFMEDLLAAWPGRDLHVILNRPSAHNPKWDRWLREHLRLRVHFAPSQTSWLNQVECWFSILGGTALSATAFAQSRQLREAIEHFVAAYHDHTNPFEWAKSPAIG